MSRDDPRVRLRHMLVYATEAVKLMRDRRRADLDIDRTLGLAVLRCVEIVGEAASRIPVAIRRRHPNIRGLRSLPCVIGSSTAMTL
jgi:uncharacterized protein with HEPN domain